MNLIARSDSALARLRNSLSPSRTVVEAIALGVLSVALLACFHSYGVHTAGGSDSYGHVSEALRAESQRCVTTSHHCPTFCMSSIR